MKVPDGIEYYPSDSRMPARLAEQLREFAYHCGETYASYLATETGWETIWCRGRRGVVRFVRWAGRYVQVFGGLLAEPEYQETLLLDFIRFAKANDFHVTFHNIGRDHLDLFRRHKFQITKNGEEPVVRLDKATWRGKDFEWVRRQENYCKRQGVELAEVRTDPNDPVYCSRMVPQLEEVSQEHIAETLHGRELQYGVGRFEPMNMGHKRLFAAKRDGRIEAFIVCNPCLSGTMWAVEMYRRRTEATRGVIPFMMLQAMRRFQAEGVTYCSLSLIPALRCGTAVKGDSWISRSVGVFWWHHLNWIFDVRGIYHFKSRFRPEYREMYTVALPRVTVLSMMALGLSWGLLSFSPWRLLQHSIRNWRKHHSRKSLAEPEYRPARVLRRLTRRAQARKGRAAPAPSGNGKVRGTNVLGADTVEAK